jgi:hypothetical protein
MRSGGPELAKRQGLVVDDLAARAGANTACTGPDASALFVVYPYLAVG